MKLFPQSKAGRIRLAILLAALVAVFAWLMALPLWGYLRYSPREGDIIFQSVPHCEFVDLIEGVTESPYSHCGVVVNRNGKWCVNEAIVTVHDTPLLSWILRGRGGRFRVQRLKPEFQPHVPAFVQALGKYQGKPYDFDCKLDDSSIYCSELVYKAFRDASGIELGKLMSLGDLNWRPFEQALRKYNGGPLPLDRQMITPRHLAEAEQLEKVLSNGL